MTDLETRLEDRLRAVLPTDADYASARHVVERGSRLAVRNGVVEPAAARHDEGVMFTIWRDGGIGYGGSYAHSDLSNTHFAMEALYYSQKVLADTEYDESNDFDLDWEAAIDFVSLVQNSEATVERIGEGFGLREEDEGGFIYFPTNTKSDQIPIKGDDGKERTALRSYGSMSYAGLLAFIYAEMDRDDPRVASCLLYTSDAADE